MTLEQAYSQTKKLISLKRIDCKDIEGIDMCRMIKDASEPNASDNNVYQKMYKMYSKSAEERYEITRSNNDKRLETIAKMENELIERYTTLYPKYSIIDIKDSFVSMYGVSISSPDFICSSCSNDRLFYTISLTIITLLIRERKIDELIEVLKEWLLCTEWTEETILNYTQTTGAGKFAICLLCDILKTSSPIEDETHLLYTGFNIALKTDRQKKAKEYIEKILSLLSQEVEEDAKEKYKEIHWKVADEYFGCAAKLVQKVHRLAKKAEIAVKKVATEESSVIAVRNDGDATIKEAVDNLQQLYLAYQALVYINMHGDILFSNEWMCGGRETEKIGKKLQNIEIKFPTSVALGMYYAFKDGEDYPWMLNISSGIATAVSRLFEMDYTDYWGEGLKNGREKNTEDKKETDGEYIESLIKGKTISPIIKCDLDEDEITILEKAEMGEYGRGAYDASRSISLGIVIDNILKKAGTDKFIEQYRKLKEGQVVLEKEVKRQDSEIHEELSGQLDEANDTIRGLREQLAEQQQKIASLKEKSNCAKEIVATAKAARDAAIAERDSAVQKTIKMEKEIAELREAAYDLASGEEEVQENVSESVELPYIANHNIIIFGGHESWLREIKSMLPNVRFYGNKTAINTDAIKGADGVYIQINKICHSNWYKIIESCDKAGVPVKNFRFSSARLCTQDVAEFDRELSTLQ